MSAAGGDMDRAMDHAMDPRSTECLEDFMLQYCVCLCHCWCDFKQFCPGISNRPEISVGLQENAATESNAGMSCPVDLAVRSFLFLKTSIALQEKTERGGHV